MSFPFIAVDYYLQKIGSISMLPTHRVSSGVSRTQRTSVAFQHSLFAYFVNSHVLCYIIKPRLIIKKKKNVSGIVIKTTEVFVPHYQITIPQKDILKGPM
jgi:hypothetical protein